MGRPLAQLVSVLEDPPGSGRPRDSSRKPVKRQVHIWSPRLNGRCVLGRKLAHQERLFSRIPMPRLSNVPRPPPQAQSSRSHAKNRPSGNFTKLPLTPHVPANPVFRPPARLQKPGPDLRPATYPLTKPPRTSARPTNAAALGNLPGLGRVATSQLQHPGPGQGHALLDYFELRADPGAVGFDDPQWAAWSSSRAGLASLPPGRTRPLALRDPRGTRGRPRGLTGTDRSGAPRPTRRERYGAG